jgi:hypothetical protein
MRINMFDLVITPLLVTIFYSMTWIFLVVFFLKHAFSIKQERKDLHLSQVWLINYNK